MSSEILVLHRGRLVPIPAATAERVASNAWELAIPVDDPIHQTTRREPTAEGWDEAVFLIDGQETQPAVGSGESKRWVRVSVFAL